MGAASFARGDAARARCWQSGDPGRRPQYEESTDRFPLVVSISGGAPSRCGGEELRLGPPFEKEEDARGSYFIDGIGVEEDGTFAVGQAAGDAAYILRRPNELSVTD